MMLLVERGSGRGTRRIVAVFGLGLIGTAVVRALGADSDFETESIPFRWFGISELKTDADGIERRISGILKSALYSARKLEMAVVWSAGQAGFSAGESVVDAELETFQAVLDLSVRLARLQDWSAFSFHLVSSLGGLYEGVKNVSLSTTPAPLRAYGQLKIEQEARLTDLIGGNSTRIYRPASVYGFPGIGYRMGLIPTLIRNGMCNRVSTIIGGMSTLRDYVMASDIGHFISRSVLNQRREVNPGPFLLASGKPSTIHEVQHAVEERLGRRIFISFDGDPRHDNSSDITVSRTALPETWFPTDLRTGINLVTERMYRRGAITAAS